MKFLDYVKLISFIFGFLFWLSCSLLFLYLSYMFSTGLDNLELKLTGQDLTIVKLVMCACCATSILFFSYACLMLTNLYGFIRYRK